MDSDFSTASKEAGFSNAPPKTYLRAIEQNKKYSSDWHASVDSRLVYIESGALYFESKSITTLVAAKHAVWIPPNQQVKLESKTTEIKFYILNFDKALGELVSNIEIFPMQSLGQKLILKLVECYQLSDVMTELEKASLLVIKLLIPQWVQAQIPLLLPASNHPKLGPALDYVKENIQTHIALDDVAKFCSMSKRTLTRLFQQELGISFSTYIRLARITLALEMFNESGASVSRVAFEVGYESITAFSNTFRLFVGIRPQEYLKKLSKS